MRSIFQVHYGVSADYTRIVKGSTSSTYSFLFVDSLLPEDFAFLFYWDSFRTFVCGLDLFLELSSLAFSIFLLLQFAEVFRELTPLIAGLFFLVTRCLSEVKLVLLFLSSRNSFFCERKMPFTDFVDVLQKEEF